MASSSPSISHVVALTIMISAAACILFAPTAAQTPALAKGLSWTFYKSSCPKLESIISKRLKEVFKKDIGQAAGLLRLHFHDCFVEGCDGSVLLTGSAGGPSAEQGSPPNLSLRQEAFRIINDLRTRIQKECGRVVSCSDIVAIAARDSVVLSGGPNYQVPLGRRDGTTLVTQATTLANLPPPFATTGTILDSLSTKNLDPTDTVALSGAHTIGISHCSSFTDRLYPNQDPTMDKTFANNLKATCPQAATTDNIVNQDIRSPNVFDNKYYVDLMNRQGLFTSDQDLYTDSRTRGIVTSFAVNQTLFFEKFVVAMIKMGQIRVLTGTQGEIRGNCSLRNSAVTSTGESSSFLKEAVEEAVEVLAGMR
ncbi:Peroxidase 12 [Linum grandiflorum]